MKKIVSVVGRRGFEGGEFWVNEKGGTSTSRATPFRERICRVYNGGYTHEDSRVYCCCEGLSRGDWCYFVTNRYEIYS